MFRFGDYVVAESLEQAYELNQKKSNVILGGMGWLKMREQPAAKVIDLSKLKLDVIEENDKEFKFGCMVTLRDIEKHQSFNDFTDNAAQESVRHIVGTQFRNTVTVGGSVYGRFGFSDVLTMFLALDSYVELYKGGIMSLQKFAKMPYDNDILINIIVKKTKGKTAYTSMRNQATDFPILTCAVNVVKEENSEDVEKVKVVIGARPGRAEVLEDEHIYLKDDSQESINKFAKYISNYFTYGNNMRASAEYRKQLSYVYTKRALEIALSK